MRLVIVATLVASGVASAEPPTVMHDELVRATTTDVCAQIVPADDPAARCRRVQRLAIRPGVTLEVYRVDSETPDQIEGIAVTLAIRERDALWLAPEILETGQCGAGRCIEPANVRVARPRMLAGGTVGVDVAFAMRKTLDDGLRVRERRSTKRTVIGCAQRDGVWSCRSATFDSERGCTITQWTATGARYRCEGDVELR